MSNITNQTNLPTTLSLTNGLEVELELDEVTVAIAIRSTDNGARGSWGVFYKVTTVEHATRYIEYLEPISTQEAAWAWVSQLIEELKNDWTDVRKPA
tara:strand:+ start:1762 stop:2052 length:291 start_codon:yes stop_codon:yes gene_type:complete